MQEFRFVVVRLARAGTDADAPGQTRFSVEPHQWGGRVPRTGSTAGRAALRAGGARFHTAARGARYLLPIQIQYGGLIQYGHGGLTKFHCAVTYPFAGQCAGRGR